jgi:hypothetical protein
MTINDIYIRDSSAGELRKCGDNPDNCDDCFKAGHVN